MSSIPNRDQPKVSHQAAWVVGCRIAGVACALASNFLIARLLGPSGFGVFLLVTTVLGFGCLIALGGLSEAGLRFVSENLGLERFHNVHLYLRSTMRWACVSTLLTSVLVVVVLMIIRRIFRYTEISNLAILLVGLGVMGLAWQQLSSQLLRGLNDVRSASFFSSPGQTGGPLSNLVFVLPLALAAACSVPLTTTTVIAMVIASIFITLPFAVWGVSRASRDLGCSAENTDKTRLLASESRTLRRVAASFLGIQTLTYITLQADIWIGSCILGSVDFGFYGAAKRGQLIATLPLQMAVLTIQGTIPRIYAQGRSSDLERLVRSTFTWASVIAIPCLLIIVVFPAQVLTLCFGAKFAGASTIVLPLAIASFAPLCLGSPSQVMSLTGNHRIVLSVNFLSAIALVVFGVLGGMMAGAIGLAIGSAATTILKNVTLWWLAKERLGIRTHLGKIAMPNWTYSNWPTRRTACSVDASAAASDGNAG